MCQTEGSVVWAGSHNRGQGAGPLQHRCRQKRRQYPAGRHVPHVLDQLIQAGVGCTPQATRQRARVVMNHVLPGHEVGAHAGRQHLRGSPLPCLHCTAQHCGQSDESCHAQLAVSGSVVQWQGGGVRRKVFPLHRHSVAHPRRPPGKCDAEEGGVWARLTVADPAAARQEGDHSDRTVGVTHQGVTQRGGEIRGGRRWNEVEKGGPHAIDHALPVAFSGV